MSTPIHLSLGLLAAALLGACAPEPARPAAAEPPRAAAPAVNPFASLSPGTDAQLRFAGRVEERLSAGPYTYLAVRPEVGAPRWVATMGAGQPVGAAVEVHGVGVRTDFRSQRLGRVFSELVFGPVSALGSVASAPVQPQPARG